MIHWVQLTLMLVNIYLKMLLVPKEFWKERYILILVHLEIFLTKVYLTTHFIDLTANSRLCGFLGISTWQTLNMKDYKITYIWHKLFFKLCTNEKICVKKWDTASMFGRQIYFRSSLYCIHCLRNAQLLYSISWRFLILHSVYWIHLNMLFTF